MPATPGKGGSGSAFSSLDSPSTPGTPQRFPTSASSTSGFGADSPREQSPELKRPGGLKQRPSGALLGFRSRTTSQTSIKSTKSAKGAKEGDSSDTTGSGLATKDQDAEELPTELTGEDWVSNTGLTSDDSHSDKCSQQIATR